MQPSDIGAALGEMETRAAARVASGVGSNAEVRALEAAGHTDAAVAYQTMGEHFIQDLDEAWLELGAATRVARALGDSVLVASGSPKLLRAVLPALIADAIRPFEEQQGLARLAALEHGVFPWFEFQPGARCPACDRTLDRHGIGIYVLVQAPDAARAITAYAHHGWRSQCLCGATAPFTKADTIRQAEPSGHDEILYWDE